MASSLVFYPRGLPFWSTDQITASNWQANAQATISGPSGSSGVAIPFIGDGSSIKTLDILVMAGSQAGTLHAEIQGVSATPDVANVSGLPDGIAITNGVAGTAAVTGAVAEKLTLTWATAPTPVGLHWLVLEGSSGGTVDIELAYVGDWVSRNMYYARPYKQVNHDGVDWNNEITVGKVNGTLFDESGNSLLFFNDQSPPVINDLAQIGVVIGADNKETLGVKFTAKAGYTNLLGINWWQNTLGVDMNYQMKIATAAGTVIASSSIFNEQHASSTGRQFTTKFDSPVTLTPGETYRVFLMNPNDTTDDVGTYYLQLNAASDLAKYFRMDSGEFELTQATDPPEYGAAGVGAWTDHTDRIPLWSLMFVEDLEAIAASGGGGSGITPMYLGGHC